ncbi:transporter [Sphingomonas sp. HF-S4]|uniref:Transporter n=1 Tax=Sphingomonas agrestis TaxID=3080540 RepID=A0ABU3Y9L3_9SPHN|nr:transporter [Sphingomonas sp. HF-S4]MDV3458094.1 transporter [Sphingomonas sp. HF-S4]
MRITVQLAAAGLIAIGSIGVAQAQESRAFCADRPGLGTPSCTVDTGHILVETGAVDWTLERDSGTRTDTFEAGDLLVRAGLTGTLEAQIGWTAFGHVRERDATGAVSHASGTGDIRVALRQNVANPDGSGFSLAVMPFGTLPVGGEAIGAGDWGAGVIMPVHFDLTNAVELLLTPKIEAAVDQDRHGRHLAYGSVVGLETPLSDTLGAALEAQMTRDDDPLEAHTEALASLSLELQPSDDLQFDAGAVAGLNSQSPDVELYIGIARRF